MNCGKCGAEARVLRVEEGVEETVVHYVCPNRRCANYKREVGEKRLLRPRQRENAQGACPVCGAKLARRGPNAHAADVFLWCKRCRREVALTLPACAPRPRTGLPPA